MKLIFNFAVLVSLLVLAACSSSRTLPETANEVARKVQSKDFSIRANYANPMRGSQLYLTSEYDLRIKNDSAFAFLPYYGVAYMAPFNPAEGGIKFAEPMEDYSLVPNKKNNGWFVRFKVNAREYNYVFSITIFANGNSSFTVTSYQRDPITFSGEMKM
ncbi:MAG TPA: DUF4251 domain-containing protein [Paludibacter sp.]|nr:DUF4251 domain-containing protein [Paludibacter sp.]